ncbi:MAG: DUF6049 family protein [Arachnia sp.]
MVRRLLRPVLAALLLVVGVLAAPTTAAADGVDPLAVTITSISTPTIDLTDPDQVIRISGTVTNVSTVRVRYAAVHFWRSPQPIYGAAQLADNAADPPAGERLHKRDQNVDVLAREEGLDPGQRATFSVEGTVHELTTEDTPLTVTQVAYLLGVQVRGFPGNESQRVVGRAAIGVAATTTPVESSAIVVLTATPSWLPSGEFLDDSLAADLDDRLETLLASAERPGVIAAVDPALYAAAGRLAEEHLIDGEKVPGSGVAMGWLRRVDALAGQGRLWRLPTGNPDLARAEASGVLDEVLGWAAAAVPETLATLPTVAVLDETATPALVARLSSLDTVVLRGATGSRNGSPRILSATSPTNDTLPDGILLARMVADELLAPTPPLYLIEDGQDARRDQYLDPTRRHVAPEAELKTELVWAAGRAAGAWPKVAAALARETGEAAVLEDLTGQTTPGLAELGATAFSSGFSNQRAALGYLDAAAKPSADLAKIELRAAASFVMGSSTSTFPATLTNGLDVPVTVGVRFTSDAPQRIGVPDIEPVTIPPGEPYTVNITPEAKANGVALVQAQVITKNGAPVGKPTTIEITATNFGRVGWLLIVTSGAVVLGGTAWRIRTVRREQAKADKEGE